MTSPHRDGRTIAPLTPDHPDDSEDPGPRLATPDEVRALEAHWSLGLLIEAVQEYAIFSLDPTGAVQTWNRGAQRIKGYTEPEILGRHFSVFYPLDDQEAHVPDDELAHATRHGQWSGEGWRVRKDGSRFWANVVITAVFDSNGRIDGFVKVTRDESDRKAAEEADHQLALLLERERIALELSETTVRSIFSATLALDSALAITTDPRITERIAKAMGMLERTLTEIRSTMTGLVSDRDQSGSVGLAPGAARKADPDSS
jgi:PAS domain S-box-containing protein